MPNIHGEYTLNEVSASLKVSTAWLTKIQKRTGVVDRPCGRGNRGYFTNDEVSMFSNAKLLRALDYSLEDIKEINDTELKMISYAKYYEGVDGEDVPNYIIHPFGITTELSKDGAGQPVTDVDLNASHYKENAAFIFEVSRDIVRRTEKVLYKMTEMQEKLKHNRKRKAL